MGSNGCHSLQGVAGLMGRHCSTLGVYSPRFGLKELSVGATQHRRIDLPRFPGDTFQKLRVIPGIIARFGTPSTTWGISWWRVQTCRISVLREGPQFQYGVASKCFGVFYALGERVYFYDRSKTRSKNSVCCCALSDALPRLDGARKAQPL